MGTTEHERPLLTSDEVSRLDESAALIVVKGMAPILGRKLGSPVPEVIDLTSSRRRMVAAVAGALLLGGSLAAFWLWPQPSPPTLTMTAPTEPTMSLVHPAPTAKITPRERLMEHQRMFMHRPPQPAWALHKLEMPSGKGSYVMRSLRAERAFADHGQCTQALLAEVSRWHAMVATSPRPSSASPMTAMKRSPRG